MLNEIDLSRADLNLLVVFEAVMAERHVGRAAARLNLTPSAISHGLGRLRRLLNDPLFLRTPKGVVPTERAEELARPIEDILSRVRGVVSTAAPFDPATSTRRFRIGAPDAILTVMSPALIEGLARDAPGVDIGLRHFLITRSRPLDQAGEFALPMLEARELDLAIIPSAEVPARFAARHLFDDDFVAVFRAGHPFGRVPDLDTFCAARHLLVSQSGHNAGFVDEALEGIGRRRRVALTVPNFMMALALLAESDLVAAMPRRLVSAFASRFGLETAELPLRVGASSICAVILKSAIMDAGIAWLFDAVVAGAESGIAPS